MDALIQDQINYQFIPEARDHTLVLVLNNEKGTYHLTRLNNDSGFHYIWFVKTGSQKVKDLLECLHTTEYRNLANNEQFFTELMFTLVQNEVTERVNREQFKEFVQICTTNIINRKSDEEMNPIIQEAPKILSDVPTTPKAPDFPITLSDSVKIPEGFRPIRVDVKILPCEFYFDGEKITCNFEKDVGFTDYPVIVCTNTKPCPMDGKDYYFINTKLEVCKTAFNHNNYHMERWLSGNFETDRDRMEKKLKEIKKILRG